MPDSHARLFYRVRYLENEYLLDTTARDRGLILNAGLLPAIARSYLEYEYRFGDPETNIVPPDAALDTLGDTLMSPDRAPSGDSRIPAGYTYLGQFIFHDITWMKIRGAHEKPVDQASPGFDLDSILGQDLKGAALESGCPVRGPLKVGLTKNGWGNPAVTFPMLEDLPRQQTASKAKPVGFPLIPDTRNDDFLPLAQTHLAMLRFYNFVACWHGFQGKHYAKDRADICFAQHVQSVVLYDYLPRVIHPTVYRFVSETGRKIVNPDNKESFKVPVEFAAAAGRFGHSMVRNTYDWNAAHRNADLTDFFDRFSFQNSLPNQRMTKLDRDWIIDWTRLYDFAPMFPTSPHLTMAKTIDTRLSSTLGSLPERIRRRNAGQAEPGPDITFNLAKETLRRQADLRMASAQFIVAEMNKVLPDDQQIRPLSPAEIAGTEPDLSGVFVRFPELLDCTPIWFYILREAELYGCDGTLGPMGSRLVMETIHAALQANPVSVVPVKAWSPSLPCWPGLRFGMANLLALAGNVNSSQL